MKIPNYIPVNMDGEIIDPLVRKWFNNLKTEVAKLRAQLSEQTKPFVYICPNGCGCLWRDNGDSTMSLFNVNQKSCKQIGGCEWLPLAKLTPLYVQALPKGEVT